MFSSQKAARSRPAISVLHACQPRTKKLSISAKSCAISKAHTTDAQPSSVPYRSSAELHRVVKDRITNIDNQNLAFRLSPFLRDRFYRQHTYLRMSLTEKCNLRCLYCMPEDGVDLTPKQNLLTTQEIKRLSSLFVSQGVNKIRLTGGEPTVRSDLIEIVASMNQLRPQGLRQIGITSNGIALVRKIDPLIASGLTHLNVSLDTLDPFKFEFMTRRRGFEAVIKSIDRALELAIESLKINVVVIKGLNDKQDVLDFIEFTKDRPVTVRFIEYMPFDGNKWQAGKLVPYQDLLQTIKLKYPEFERRTEKDDANDTSKHWQVRGYKGSVGFITSMTDNFCGTCNRLRITADGNLKVCLFGNAEVSLRDAMRQGFISPSPLVASSDQPATDEQLLHIIGAAVGRKYAKHAGMKDSSELARLCCTELRSISSYPKAQISGLGRFKHDSRRTSWMAPTAKRTRNRSPLSYNSAWTYAARTFATSRTILHRKDDQEDDSPWGELDDAFDNLYKYNLARPIPDNPPVKMEPQNLESSRSAPTELEEAIFAQAGAASVTRGLLDGQSQLSSLLTSNLGVTGNQSWSQYMGAAEEDGDSPWASLDAFADSSFDATGLAAPIQNRMPQGTLQSRPIFQQGPEIVPSHLSQRIANDHLTQESVYTTLTHAVEPAAPRLTHVKPGTGRASMVDVGWKPTTQRSATAVGKVYITSEAAALIRRAEASGSPASQEAVGGIQLTKGPVLHTAQLAGIMGAKKTSDLIPLCHSLSLSHVNVHVELFDQFVSGINQTGTLIPSLPNTTTTTATTTITNDGAKGPSDSVSVVKGFSLEQLQDPDSWYSLSDDESVHPSSNPGTSTNTSTNLTSYIQVTCTAKTNGQTGVEMEALTGCSIACLTIWDMVKAVAGKQMKIGEIMVIEKTGGKSGNWKRIRDL